MCQGGALGEVGDAIEPTSMVSLWNADSESLPSRTPVRIQGHRSPSAHRAHLARAGSASAEPP